MSESILCSAIGKLRLQFPTLDWTYHDFPVGSAKEKMYRWPGADDENIIIVVHQSSGVQELFHRHDFFYFNYTYAGEYDSLSYKYDNKITIREHELYAGQPFAGHALCVHDNHDTTIIGVLIRKETFFRSYLPMLSSNSKLFRFFLDPATNYFSEEFIHFKIEDDCNIRTLLEMMVIEYADKQSDTQDVLKPLVLAFLMQVARRYAQMENGASVASEKLPNKIVQYMSEHTDVVSLKSIAFKFGYHPNYISTLLHKETGKSFSELLLEQRMLRAVILMKGTDLSLEEISYMLGYKNTSNFYKAFKEYYKRTPREYLK